MFTGIIEAPGKVVSLEKNNNNLHITIESPISGELKVDQSVAHNGVCLTVTECDSNNHKVIAVDETLKKSNLGILSIGSIINLERAMLANGRFDGHIVQGHVDQTAQCTRAENHQGSWKFWFEFNPSEKKLLVEKGSICINGVSLTVVDVPENEFSVVIIPYTYENTSFGMLKAGDTVNLEFDIIGKYVATRLGDYVEPRS